MHHFFIMTPIKGKITLAHTGEAPAPSTVGSDESRSSLNSASRSFQLFHIFFYHMNIFYDIKLMFTS